MSRAHPAAALVLAVAFGLLGAGSIVTAATFVPGQPAARPPQVASVVEGVDISNWQGTIDWTAVAGAGKAFAIAKATEGETYKDPYYPANHANARAAGVRIGAYHFAQPGNPSSEAVIQADWFLQNAGPIAGDLIPALDLEVSNGLSVADLQAWVLAYLTEIEAKSGAKAMIYVNPNFWSTNMGNTTMFADLGYTTLWIAHWGVANPTVPAANWGGRGWTFWQYTNCGTVPGIAGCVDLDRYNGADLTPVLFGPGVPSAVTGVPADRQVAVSWAAPAASSGGALTGYTVSAAPGGATCTTAGATACTVTGLTNGSHYTFSVSATNASGTGQPSAASGAVTPRTVPDAPTGAAATPGNTTAQVSWVAPAWNGGAPVTGYTVTASPGGKTCTTAGTLTCTVSGLANGTPYTFAVSASNVAGAGASSAASGAITPRTVPDAPTGAAAVPGDAFATVTWAAPAWNGGSAITGYTVTSSSAGKTCTTAGTLACNVLGLSNGTSYTFSVTATNVAGVGPASGPTAITTPWPPISSTFVPMAPARLLDTRIGNGLGGPFSSGVARTFLVAGRAGVPANATAVTGNLTVTDQTAPGAVYLGPTPTPAPTSSTLNFPSGDVRANGVTVALGAGGTLSATYFVAPAGSTVGLVFDVTGYFVPDASGARFVPLAPVRLLDTRAGNGLTGPFQAGAPRTFQVGGHGGVPTTAIAVTGNLTVTDQTAPGAIYLGPDAVATPGSSTLNFPASDVRANGVTVALGTGGTLSATYIVAPAGNSTALVFDVTGYFVPGASGATYVPLSPARVLDTRIGNGLPGAVGAGQPSPFQVTGRGGVPASAVAVTGNLTVADETAAGAIFLGPSPTASPGSSTLNFPPGDVRANGVSVALGAGGTLAATYIVAPAGNTTSLVFDVTGYFVP